MQKHIFLTALLVLATSLSVNCAEPEAYVKMRALSSSYIRGEPMYVWVEKYGTPYAGDYYLDGDLCVDTTFHGDGPALAPGERLEDYDQEAKFNPEVRVYYIDVTRSCMWRIEDQTPGIHKYCYKDGWVEGCVEFKVLEPAGVDAEIFEKMNPKARNFEESGVSKEDILKDFPTSVYAGWALGAGFGSKQRYEKVEDYLKESIENASERTVKGMKEYSGERIKKLDDYLSIRPDFALADWMKLETAFRRIYRGEYQQAHKIALSLREKAEGKDVKELADKFIKAMEEKGILGKSSD